MTPLLALVLVGSAQAQQVTGLSDWSLFLDPGHSGTDENVGIYGYSEPEKVLRVGLALREMLETRTDIEAVYMSRTDDTQQVSLSQRTDLANSLGADFFHSIHSNAGPPSANNVLMLYGGWRSNGVTVEKTPEGGRRMGAEYEDALSRAMRLPTIGNFADRTFYLGFPETHANQFPYLFVNRTSNMASVLSEGGFHTNPTQNTRNMNADWKRLEAQAHYWAILDWHGIPRSTHRIATGFVTDAESGRPINGATVEVDGQTYTTDTYESLFNRFSNDPDQLRNGFYYLEDVGPGTHTVTVSADGYASATATVTMKDTTFTFADVALTSTVPPVVAEADPAEGDPSFPITDAIRLTFSRPLDPATAAPAFSLVPSAGGPPVAGTVTFERGGYELVFTPDEPLAPTTAFTLTLAGTATTANGSPIDGDGDGTGGDDFTLTFTSSFPDTTAPRLAQSDPRPNATGAELRPVVTVAFTEAVDPATLDGRVTLETVAGAAVAGTFVHTLAGVVGEDPDPQSTVSFVPDAPLASDTRYRFAIEPGVEDVFSNATTARYAFLFETAAADPMVELLDDFEGSSISDNWWVPQQSGSTGGIVTDSTSAAADSLAYPLGGETAMRVDYGWAETGPWLIREYLAGGAPRDRIFDDSFTLRARVFGDGTGTLFRFAVDDGLSGGHEVSPWTAVDWLGWRTVTWDLDADGFGTWIGNGAWDAPSQLRFDSFQLGYDGASPRFGALVFDDLALLSSAPVAAAGGPDGDPALRVAPIWPNPARTTAEVRLVLGAPTTVTAEVFNAIGQRVAVLADGVPRAAGEHRLTWPTAGAASGVYVVRVTAGTERASASVVVAR
ncbi:Ig-like domain-containing protein [Rubrivirga sp.]|uniref:Ig-like domain-containing protein n=1 Tax=Rubrivirga sp. TaxID=1885344 RepID=UPI003B5286A6